MFQFYRNAPERSVHDGWGELDLCNPFVGLQNRVVHHERARYRPGLAMRSHIQVGVAELNWVDALFVVGVDIFPPAHAEV